jgi:CRP-like cAMP-binding protein
LNVREALCRVPWLASLSPGELDELACQSEQVRFRSGQTLVAELELGEDLYILLEGRASTAVASEGGDQRKLSTLEPGDTCGEVSVLSHGLRSVTVTADCEVLALRLSGPQVERVAERHPEIALHFARQIATRIVDSDHLLDAVLSDSETAAAATQRLAVSSLRRAWNELVVGRRHELPILALASFMVTLVLVRVLARLLERMDVGLFAFLRDAYIAGILLVFASTAIALVRFRPRTLKAVSVVYGIGFALILNELSVFLAFDIFYIDMSTRDPTLAFDVESLYRRGESTWAVVLMLAFLVQLVFLRDFYLRGALVLRSHLARWLGSRS